MTGPRVPLPIGINSLQTIIEYGMAYVARPPTPVNWRGCPVATFCPVRRFGKSLFLDTLKELFEGNEPLFRGLYAHDHWDWSRRFPTIKLDFAGGVLESRAALDHRIYALLQENAQRLGVDYDPD
ncbi:MAG: AAA family ATPase [Candidatus Competibacteraceae bacterium]|nr:AAA family ATPase [Candidatus Competibacteraceae bacterium]